MVPLNFFLFLVLLPLVFSDLAADRAALLRLRDAVGGRTLFWNVTAANATCSWEGVVCDNVTNRVTELRLPGDRLSGRIPLGTVGNLTELRVLSLRKNSLSGELPPDLAACTQLNRLVLNGNRFSGEVPDEVFTMVNLRHVNLGRNRFTGNISAAFNNLINLRTLFLEQNQFVGTLPELPDLSRLSIFNVSFNQLTGPIPPNLATRFASSSFIGTTLCGHPLPSCPHHSNGGLSGGAIAGISIGSLILLMLTLVILFILFTKLKTRKIQPQIHQASPSPASPAENPQTDDLEDPNTITIGSDLKEEVRKTAMSSDGLTFFGDDVEAFTLEQLLKASAELIGKGTVGSTYKAYFDSGVEVIVRRLKNVCLNEDPFRVKIEEMGGLVDGHLEPLRGYFYGKDEKLLLYEPIPNGSLFSLLHGNKQGPVSWKIRTKIALGAARGIKFLHSSGTAHGNIKSSNVFLTEYYNARVSEFGLTQLVSPISSMSGYRAPEVTDTRQITPQADVYSFGVLMLELATGKFPDKALTEEGIELPNWVESVGAERWKEEVLDAELVEIDFAEVEEMVEFVKLAVACGGRSPDRRPSMAEVVRKIEEVCGEKY